MKNSITKLIVGLGIILLFLLTVEAQTIEELTKQKEELEQKIKILKDIQDLKNQIKTLEAEKPPKGDDSSGQNENGGNANKNVVTQIEGIKNLFTTKNNTVINSVCTQQGLEPKRYTIYDKTICDAARQMVANLTINGDDKIVFDRGEFTNSLSILIAGRLASAELPPSEALLNKDVKNFIIDVEDKRTDKQMGSDSKAAGTTSLAVKGGIPRFLGWAMENGGVTGSRDGNTLTFRVNPVGLLESLSRHPVVEENGFGTLFDEEAAKPFRNFSAGFSFDITRGTDPPVFIGSKQQLSAVSLRYNFINQKDPRNPIYKNDWELFRKDYLETYTAFANSLHGKLLCVTCLPTKYQNTDLEKWFSETAFKLSDIDTKNKSDIELVELARQTLADQLSKLPVDKIKTDTAVINLINENGKKLIVYSNAKKALREKIAKGSVVTLEYTNYRNVNEPDLSNIRFIAEKGLGSDWSLTANASVSFFNKRPSGANTKRIRDFDFTLELEKPLPELSFGKPIFSFSGQYQRLAGDVPGLDGLVKPNTKGDIAIGQFKLTIPIKGTGIKIPFSLTFANRSDLIKESTVRGNFGFTFDLDRLLLGKEIL